MLFFHVLASNHLLRNHAHEKLPPFSFFSRPVVWLHPSGCIRSLFLQLHPLPEDTFYVIVRVATVVRTAVVGGTALGSGIFFMTGVGLLLLSGRVAVGVASGELDMNAPQTLARKG